MDESGQVSEEQDSRVWVYVCLLTLCFNSQNRMSESRELSIKLGRPRNHKPHPQNTEVESQMEWRIFGQSSRRKDIQTCRTAGLLPSFSA